MAKNGDKMTVGKNRPSIDYTIIHAQIRKALKIVFALLVRGW